MNAVKRIITNLRHAACRPICFFTGHRAWNPSPEVIDTHDMIAMYGTAAPMAVNVCARCGAVYSAPPARIPTSDHKPRIFDQKNRAFTSLCIVIDKSCTDEGHKP